MDNKICKCGRKLYFFKTIKTKNYIVNKYKDEIGRHIHDTNEHYDLYKCTLNHDYRIYYPNRCLCGWFSI